MERKLTGNKHSHKHHDDVNYTLLSGDDVLLGEALRDCVPRDHVDAMIEETNQYEREDKLNDEVNRGDTEVEFNATIKDT